MTTPPGRVLLLGASGTIGRATARALVQRGHDVVCILRPGGRPPDLPGTIARVADVTDPVALARDGLQGERFDAIVSCLASRTGAPRDAWAIDHAAHLGALDVAIAAGIPHMVLLSAICVQKPRLAFQHAKLAFERALTGSGLRYSIVRPTAYFKSLSGQIDRLRRGKPFLLFGDGTLTACKPISDDDLAHYIADCITDPAKRNQILPIGGPGDAITPKQQGEHLFALLHQPPRFKHVPVALLDGIILTLGTLGHAIPALTRKADLARIGRYYATESMLLLDSATSRYDAAATPATGSETLFDFYARLVEGTVTVDRGDHAVF